MNLFLHKLHASPWVRACWVTLALAMTGMAQAQDPLAEPERDDDEEPNQHAVLEPLGTESEEERSRWLLEGAELVLKPRTYYLHRDYDVANTRAGWPSVVALSFGLDGGRTVFDLVPLSLHRKNSTARLIKTVHNFLSLGRRAFLSSAKPTQRCV